MSTTFIKRFAVPPKNNKKSLKITEKKRKLRNCMECEKLNRIMYVIIAACYTNEWKSFYFRGIAVFVCHWVAGWFASGKFGIFVHLWLFDIFDEQSAKKWVTLSRQHAYIAKRWSRFPLACSTWWFIEKTKKMQNRILNEYTDKMKYMFNQRILLLQTAYWVYVRYSI